MVFAVLYDLVVRGIWRLIRFLGLWSAPMHRLSKTRKIPLPVLPEAARENRKLIWMHCASLGEFEQGKPLIRAMKEKDPANLFLISFFSLSGFEQVKTGQLIDYKCYLPVDTASNARQFIQKYQPDAAIFVKYEFWFNYLRILNRSNIPVYFISVILEPGHFLMRAWGGPWLKQMKQAAAVFVQDEQTEDLLKRRGLTQVIRTGDTRVDTVADLPETAYSDPVMEGFCSTSQRPILVVGSCWKSDIDLLASLDRKWIGEYRWIVAPHKISGELLDYVERLFSSLRPERYSRAGVHPDSDLLIIDRIGILKFLYRYADLVYIGGGFGAGIHNTLEPAAYGKPVIFGPKYRKFREARRLVQEKAFYTVRNAEELKWVLEFLNLESNREMASGKILRFISENRDATRRILEKMEHF
jgi:3-deoxy-D-manno-octulosonic-acid transferase